MKFSTSLVTALALSFGGAALAEKQSVAELRELMTAHRVLQNETMMGGNETMMDGNMTEAPMGGNMTEAPMNMSGSMDSADDSAGSKIRLAVAAAAVTLAALW